ncbi:hypothetical protein CHS0354_041343 [Potamilus streckersoni]|uniref:Domain of unknown function with conserved HDNR motif domain-containing protein n=1 Tax=Potamilus streckersoni TaxID=2493646 RepID=A0AAE0VV82_9BIVA|nr:hypothetical protein CHS0354_041343 [Potamilus streckersoni]
MSYFWLQRPVSGKHPINYKSSNKFSEHDNRHSFQTHGVYFGDGKDSRQLGRRNINADMRIHHTEKDFFKHNGIEVTEYDYRTTYGNSFIGDPTPNPPTFRRFRKSLPPPKTARFPNDTTVTDWFQPPIVPFRTPTHVLAISQEPFLKHNAWKYSNHSLKNVYPPYETRSEPLVKNTFNKYGAAFRTFASEPTTMS